MSRLDTWLWDECELKREDIEIDITKLVADASRFSKETSQDAVPWTMDGLMDTAAKIHAEMERSEKEDRLGIDRSDQDQHLSESMLTTRQHLAQLGDVITLDSFPFAEILPSVRDFVATALQLRIASSIGLLKAMAPHEVACIDGYPDLGEILQEELDH